MKSAEILARTDRTSWSRIVMVWRFYSPCLRRLLLLFPLFSVLVFLLSLTFSPTEHLTLYGACSSMLTICVIFSPLAFASQRGRDVEAMLPALGFEKCTAVILWTLVAVPLLVEGPFQLLTYLHTGMSTYTYTMAILPVDDRSIFDGMGIRLVAFSLATVGCMILSCLWGVMASSRRRVLNGVLAVVGCYAFIIVAASLISAVAGVYVGFQAAGGTEAEVMARMPEIEMTVVRWLMAAFIPVSVIYAIFALVKYCRAIARRQF